MFLPCLALSSGGQTRKGRHFKMTITTKDMFTAVRKFSDESVAVKEMRESQFLSEPKCRTCGGTRLHFMQSAKRYKCRDCYDQFSEKIGTIMQNSALPVGTWASGAWLLANAAGMTSVRMAELLAVTQLTAWRMCQKFNRHSDRLEVAGRPAPVRYVAWQRPVKEISEHYPYTPSRDDSANAIVKAVYEIVLRDCPQQMRADVSQELLLRIFSGETTLETCRELIPELRKDNWLYAEKFHTHVSINAPVYEDGAELGETLLLDINESMEKNFMSEYDDDEKTGHEWKSTKDSRFGKVLARY